MRMKNCNILAETMIFDFLFLKNHKTESKKCKEFFPF